MPHRRSTGPAGRLADLGLSALLILAPLAGGSWTLEVLPGLLVIAVIAWGATLYGLGRRGRSLHISWLSVGLLLLALFTALQAVPLPADLLALISPEAHRLRSFVQGQGAGPLSYEPGATLRESTKLIIYALVVATAVERTQGRGLKERIAQPLLISGLAAAGVAILHRALGIERLFGLLSPITSSRRMLSTFVNPNHAAGFMVLVTLTALGLALKARQTRLKLAYLACATLTTALCIYTGSKGGIGALIIGLLLFAGLWAARDFKGERTPPRWISGVIGAVLLGPVLLFTARIEQVTQFLKSGSSGGLDLGLAEKAAALQDALPMAMEHAWAGIGRGAYASVYTRYKTSDLQLTFAFPENIVAQLIGEWGIFVGLGALLGISAVILSRLWMSQRPLSMAMMAGVTAVLIQNLFDFSLELPGVAIPVLAILGGVSANWHGAHRISTKSPITWAGTALILVVGLGTCIGAFMQGDLPNDLERLQARIEAKHDRLATLHSTEQILARHPASALIAAQAAHLAEISDPPQLENAVRWANRTLYLAPTYAGGHLVTGRLLIRAGHRDQGFSELRRAWTLSGADRRAIYIAYVSSLARSPQDIARAVPRRDPTLDILSERSLALIVRHLATHGKAEWARSLLENYVDIQETPLADLHAITVAADTAGATDLALQAARRLLKHRTHDDNVRLLAARIAFRHGRTEEARALLGQIEGTTEPEALFELRFRIELGDGDIDAAETTLRKLKAIATPGSHREAQLTVLEVQLHTKANRPARALETLDQALARRPGNLDLRMHRARLLVRSQRPERAISDLQYLLKRRPNDPPALALLKQAQRSTNK